MAKNNEVEVFEAEVSLKEAGAGSVMLTLIFKKALGRISDLNRLLDYC